MDKEFTADYSKFQPEVYLKSYHCEPRHASIKAMQWLHEVFSSGLVKGQRLLDVGTGPTIHTVISAAAHVDSIFLSDVAPQNIASLKGWLDGSLEFSFENHFKYVCELEGSGVSPRAREMVLKEKIAGICKIDLLEEDPFTPSVFPQFDIITTALCLISVAENICMYKKIVRRVANLLRVGGHVLLSSIGTEGYYEVGNVKFKSLSIDKKTVQDIWKECGFEIIEWKQEATVKPGEVTVSLYFLMVARKTKSLLK